MNINATGFWITVVLVISVGVFLAIDAVLCRCLTRAIARTPRARR